MEPNRISAAAFADTKQHYAILDGLRGVAALTVVCFHLFEAFATSHLDQRINHGYLAVDFFFILSGFVVGYAYDDRWGRMGVGEFLKRRFIRLHPMVVFGALIGAAVFYTQGCPVWDVSKISLGALAVATLMNALLLPAPISMEVRGVGGDVPAEWPELVVAVRIHRQHTLRFRAAPAADACARRTGRRGGMLARGIRHVGAAGGCVRGFLDDGRQYCGRHAAPAVCLPDGTAALASVPSAACARRLLDRGCGHRDTLGRAASGRQRALVAQRPLRFVMFFGGLPSNSVDRSFGKDYRRIHYARVQVSGRHIISALYGSLPVHIHILRLGQEQQPDLRREFPRGGGPCGRVGSVGIRGAAALRRACAAVPYAAHAASRQVRCV